MEDWDLAVLEGHSREADLGFNFAFRQEHCQ